MKAIRKLGNKRALSPVIATVILVAVSITVAVAVAYWMSGIASQYTSFEKVEIQTAICTWDGDATVAEWKIEIKLKNSGTATATLTNLFINEIEVNDYKTTAATPTTATLGEADTDMSQTETIESGDTITINIFIDGLGDTAEDPTNPLPTDQWQKVSSGTTVNIKIHSAGGMDYIRLVKLT